LAPLFITHFLFNYLYQHYSFSFLIILLTVIFLSNFIPQVMTSRKLAFITLGIFILTSMSIYTKAVNFVFFDKNSKCIVDESKLDDTNAILAELNRPDSPQSIVSSGGVIPRIIYPGRKVYHLGGWSKAPETFDYLLLELNGSGDTFPLSPEQIKATKERCQQLARQVILDNQYYYFARGTFPANCL
ncbi:MAG: hypothetical protein WCG27_06470, partial [Pseudomonadota bacterium]